MSLVPSTVVDTAAVEPARTRVVVPLVPSTVVDTATELVAIEGPSASAEVAAIDHRTNVRRWRKHLAPGCENRVDAGTDITATCTRSDRGRVVREVDAVIHLYDGLPLADDGAAPTNAGHLVPFDRGHGLERPSTASGEKQCSEKSRSTLDELHWLIPLVSLVGYITPLS